MYKALLMGWKGTAIASSATDTDVDRVGLKKKYTDARLAKANLAALSTVADASSKPLDPAAATVTNWWKC